MKNKIFMVVCLLFGAIMVAFGLDKFLEFMPTDDLPIKMAAFQKILQQSQWIWPLVGIAEVVAGVLIMLPQYRALGAVILTPVMVGIVLANYHNAPDHLPFAGVLAAILVWIIFENKKKYTPMLRK